MQDFALRHRPDVAAHGPAPAAVARLGRLEALESEESGLARTLLHGVNRTERGDDTWKV